MNSSMSTLGKTLAAAFAVAASSASAVETVWNNPGYKWTPSGDGPYYWNDAANWEKADPDDETGHQPTSFQAAVFDVGGTVKIPAATLDGPFTEGSMLFPRVGNFPRGDKLTIDGSGTYWLKMADANDTIQTWNYLNRVDFGGYFWGGEGHSQAYADDAAEFLATNAVLEIARAPADEEDGATLTLKQGFLNFYDPLGEGHAAHAHTFNLFATAQGGAKVIYEDGTHTRTRNMSVLANGPDSLFWIKGGTHEVFGNFPVKNQNTAYPATVRVSGGLLDVSAGWMVMGYVDKTSGGDFTPVGRVVLDGTGTLRHNCANTTFIGYGRYGAEGHLEMSGNSSYEANSVQVGAQNGSKGFLTMEGDSSATVNDVMLVSAGTSSTGMVSLAGNSLLAASGNLIFGYGASSHGELDMTGGKITANSQILFSNGQNSHSVLNMTGGEIVARNNLIFNNNSSASGSYYIGGNAKIDHSDTAAGCVYLGNGDNTDTEVVLGDNAEMTGKFWLGNTGRTRSDTLLVVTNNATLNWRGEHMTLGAASTNRLVVTDNATLNLVGNIVMGWRDDANSLSEAVFDDSMKLKGTGQIILGQSASHASRCRLFLRGGRSLSPCGNILVNYGIDSKAVVSGGDWLFNNLTVRQSAGYDASTNVFRVTGGKIRFNGATVVGDGNALGRIEVDGGEFSTRKINLGLANQASDQMCIMRVTGGTVKVEQGADDAYFQFGNGTGSASRGRLEQTGGEICAHSIRGNHSASGRSEAFFDGGKVVQSVKVHGSCALIQDLTRAEVGATGLTVDANGFAAYLKQEFADADDGNGGTVDGVVRITGSGSMDIRRDSNHAKTIVDGGRMSFSNGATVFGRTVQLVNNGVYSLVGDATTFSFNRLVIGDATSAGVLKLDPGDTITITGADGLEVNNLVLDVSHITNNGSYQVFQTSGDGTIDPAKLGSVTLKTSDPLKSYTLNADGTVTVSDRVFAQTQWLGTQSSLWDTDDNWSAGAPSGADVKAVFGSVDNKMVETSSGASAGILEFDSPNYYVYGSAAVSVGAAIDNQSSGTVTIASPVTLGEIVSVVGAAGSTTTFGGALSGADVTVRKTGSGKAVVSGNNAGLDATWKLDGGTLEFASHNAIGSGVNSVEIGSGTLAYTGESAATAGGSLLVNAATGVGAIADIVGDLTFTNAEVRSGRFVKKGVGTLAFDLGAGTYPFADTGDVRVGNNMNEIATDIAFNASGDSQASSVSANMFYPLTVAEGSLVFSGAGSNATTVVHRNGLSVGDTYAGAQACSELVLKNLYFDNSVDALIAVGRKMNAPDATESWLKVLDGAHLNAFRMWVGWNSSVPTASGLAVTNATVQLAGRMFFGGGANATGMLRIGTGGKVQVNGSFDFRGKADILVEGEGAALSAPNANGRDNRYTWDGNLQFEDANGSGTMAFKNGGSLTLGGHIHGANFGVNGTTSPGLRFVFDGGALTFLNNGTSIMARPQYQYVRTEGAGMTVSVADGAVQTFTIPIRGNGGFVKTGGGELVFADVRDFTSWPNKDGYFDFQYNETDIQLGQYEGATEVREGILTLYAGMLTNTTAVTVGEAGALNLGGNAFEFPTVEGLGVISNGTLNAVIKVALDRTDHTGAMPTFSDVTLPLDQRLAFEIDGEPEFRVPYTLSATGCSAAEMSYWRATCNGMKCLAEFTVDGSGRAVVTLRKMPGLSVIIR